MKTVEIAGREYRLVGQNELFCNTVEYAVNGSPSAELKEARELADGAGSVVVYVKGGKTRYAYCRAAISDCDSYVERSLVFDEKVEVFENASYEEYDRLFNRVYEG